MGNSFQKWMKQKIEKFKYNKQSNNTKKFYQFCIGDNATAE